MVFPPNQFLFLYYLDGFVFYPDTQARNYDVILKSLPRPLPPAIFFGTSFQSAPAFI